MSEKVISKTQHNATLVSKVSKMCNWSHNGGELLHNGGELLHNGGELLHNIEVKQNTLIIHEVRMENRGKYVCLESNSFGKITKKEIILIVLGKFIEAELKL